MKTYTSPEMTTLSFTADEAISAAESGNLANKGSKIFNDGELEW